MVSVPGRAHGNACACLLALALVGLVPVAGKTAEPAKDTSRIVSVGGDITEIVYALGLGNRIVAVDTTSQYPPEALKEKKNVGYMRALSSEGVLSVNPTVIIATAGAGPPEVVAALKASSIPYVEVSCEDTADGVVKKVQFVARALGAESAAEALSKSIGEGFDALAEERSHVEKPVRALFILAVQNGRAVVGGRNTGADAIFRLAGATNAAAEIDGFKPLSDEAAVTMAPDVIVMMRRGEGHGASEIAAMPGLNASAAARNGRMLEFDGSYLLQFGPRAASAARDLLHAFYPEVSAPPEKK